MRQFKSAKNLAFDCPRQKRSAVLNKLDMLGPIYACNYGESSFLLIGWLVSEEKC